MSAKAGFTLIEVLVTLTVLSVSALGIMNVAKETQDVSADITHMNTMSRLATLQMNEMQKEGFSSSTSREGEFDDYPGYEWNAKSNLARGGGWYIFRLTVRRVDTGRKIILERLFRERL